MRRSPRVPVRRRRREARLTGLVAVERLNVVVSVRCAVEEAVLVVVIVSDESRVGFGVVGNVNLLQLRLRLDRFHALLLHVAIGGLPHVVVFDDVLQRLPRKLNEKN